MKKYQTKVLIMVLSSLPLLSGCFGKLEDASSAKYLQSSKSGSTGGGGGGGAINDPSFDLPTSTGVAGITNFQEVSNAMSAATGVARDAQINTLTTANTTNLPAIGTNREVSPVSINAMIQLSGLFCQKSIAAEAANANPGTRKLFPMLNFANTATQSQLSGAIRDQLCQSLAQNFWQRPATAVECGILSQAIDDTTLGRPSSQTEFRNAVQVTCSAALVSLQALGL